MSGLAIIILMWLPIIIACGVGLAWINYTESLERRNVAQWTWKEREN